MMLMKKKNMKTIKKTVGIVTLEDHKNYGNRLQNFALTRLLEENDIEVINGIRVVTKQDYIEYTSGKTKQLLKRILPFFLIKKRITPKEIKTDEIIMKRMENSRSFERNYLSVIPPIVTATYKQALKKLKKYHIDYYITGSDQVWNPQFAGQNYEFLTFSPKNSRLSFAASIGAEEIPINKKERYAKNLSEMKYLSVRESRAVELIKELTGREADLTLDPTLLLETEKWQMLISKPNIFIPHHYICSFFLGDIPNAVDDFAKEKGIPVIVLNSVEFPELFTIDPAEFLHMIQNAEYVLTDSFHAVAFSIKFHKEFYVFHRQQTGFEQMFSRIETITKRFGLENRIQDRDRIIEQEPISNWNDIEDELMAEKKRSMGKLLEAMGI